MAGTLLEDFIAEPPPLHRDAGEVVRVGGTRVTLDTVVGAYLDGASAEQIAEGYDALRLADVHAAISFYLRHREEVDAYLSRRRQDAERVRSEVEARPASADLRRRLLARQESKASS